MINYETMYIVHPALESGRLKDLILSVEKSMHNLGGKTTAINVWGKKKLAYPINKERYGMYILFQFQNHFKNKNHHHKSVRLNSPITISIYCRTLPNSISQKKTQVKESIA